MENYIFQITWIVDLTRQRRTILTEKKIKQNSKTLIKRHIKRSNYWLRHERVVKQLKITAAKITQYLWRISYCIFIIAFQEF